MNITVSDKTPKVALWIQGLGAGISFLLVVAAFCTIIVTQKRNKAIDEWYQRNEEMSILPFLSLREVTKVDDPYYKATSFESPSSGWFSSFAVVFRNVGSGPVINMRELSATQGQNRFTAFKYGTSNFSSILGVGEEQLVMFECTNKDFIPRSDSPPAIEITVKFDDIYGGNIILRYIMAAATLSSGKRTSSLAVPIVSSFSINGNERTFWKKKN